MQLNITGRNLEITPAIRNSTTEKFQRLENHFHQITHVNIVYHLEHITHIAEARLHAYGAEIHATAEDKDLYSAIDSLVDKLQTQIVKHKEKMTNHHKG